MEFHEILRQLRKERGLSQTKAATGIGKKQRMYSFWETGSFEPNMEEIRRLCHFYDVSADYLLGLTAERKPCPKE